MTTPQTSQSGATPSASEKPPWPLTKEGYVLGDVIGSGATACVQQATCPIRGDESCAIKRIDLERCQTTFDELRKEIAAMSSCQHDNVVGYYTSFLVNTELWVVLELCSGGSLLDIIRQRIATTEDKGHYGIFDEATIATVLKEVLQGLDYFHSNDHIHRDIKAGNILIKQNGAIKIADFGVAACLAQGNYQRDPVTSEQAKKSERKRHTFVGTPCWIAPEVIDNDGTKGYDSKADIWSVGITAFELATGAAPYHKYPPMKVLMLTIQSPPPTLDTNAEKDQYKQYGKSFRKFIAACLQKDPTARPTCKELLKHDFLKKAKDKTHLVKTVLANVKDAPVSRGQKVRRVPGTSGRMHRTTDGDWEWSDPEDEAQVPGTVSGDTITPGSQPQRIERPAIPVTAYVPPLIQQQSSQQPPATPGDTQQQGAQPPQTTEPSRTYNLVLRLRNERNELNDISFDLTSDVDTANSVAQELFEASLVSGKDYIVIGANVRKVLENPEIGTSLVFKLDESNLPTNQVATEKTLQGFAQLTLNDICDPVTGESLKDHPSVKTANAGDTSGAVPNEGNTLPPTHTSDAPPPQS